MSHAPGRRLPDVAGREGSDPSSAMSRRRLRWPLSLRSITLRNDAVLWPRRLTTRCLPRLLRHRWWDTWIQHPFHQLLWFNTWRPPPAVTFAAPAPVVGYVAPAPAVTYVAPAPVIDYVAPAHSVTYAVPAPVIDYVAPAHSVTYAVPAPVIDYVAPAHSVTHAVNICVHTLAVLVLCIFGTCRAFRHLEVFLSRCSLCQVFMCTRVCLPQGPLSLCLRSFL